MAKEIILSLGDFQCTLRGYDDPIPLMRDIASIFPSVLDSAEVKERIDQIERNYERVEFRQHAAQLEKSDDIDSHAVERLLAQVEAQFSNMQTARSGNLLAQLRVAAAKKLQAQPANDKSKSCREQEHKILTQASPLNLSPEHRIENEPSKPE